MKENYKIILQLDKETDSLIVLDNQNFLAKEEHFGLSDFSEKDFYNKMFQYIQFILDEYKNKTIPISQD